MDILNFVQSDDWGIAVNLLDSNIDFNVFNTINQDFTEVVLQSKNDLEQMSDDDSTGQIILRYDYDSQQFLLIDELHINAYTDFEEEIIITESQALTIINSFLRNGVFIYDVNGNAI